MNDGLVPILLFLLVALLLFVAWTLLQQNRRLRIREQRLRREADRLGEQMNQLVQTHVENWKRAELESVVRQQREVALREARAALATWKQQNLDEIRKAAITKSRSVTLGKVAEHVAPFFPVFPFNPKDARFIGSPVDFVVFDGADEGEVRRVVLLEVKSGTSNLNTKQRRIRDAVREGRVEWLEVRVAEPVG